MVRAQILPSASTSSWVFSSRSFVSTITRPELDVEGIGVVKVFDFHGSNERSKNALCTVSPSGRSTTRRYLPSISRDQCPAAYPTVRLNHLPHGLFDNMLDPLHANHRTIRAESDGLEVSCELQPNRCRRLPSMPGRSFGNLTCSLTGRSEQRESRTGGARGSAMLSRCPQLASEYLLDLGRRTSLDDMIGSL